MDLNFLIYYWTVKPLWFIPSLIRTVKFILQLIISLITFVCGSNKTKLEKLHLKRRKTWHFIEKVIKKIELKLEIKNFKICAIDMFLIFSNNRVKKDQNASCSCLKQKNFLQLFDLLATARTGETFRFIRFTNLWTHTECIMANNKTDNSLQCYFAYA